MCDASNYAVGAVLGQRRNKFFHAIYYASKVLNENQVNYSTTEKELLAVIFALEKFCSYLIGSKVHHIENKEVTKKEKAIMAEFPDEQLFAVGERPWFVDMANYKAGNIVPDDLNSAQKKKFFKDSNHYLWDDPYLFKVSTDGFIRRCVAGEEANSIMWHCHSSAYGGHHSGERTAAKILQSGF